MTTREQNREHQKAYRERINADPAKRAARLKKLIETRAQRSETYYKNLYDDPTRYEAYLERRRLAQAARMQDPEKRAKANACALKYNKAAQKRIVSSPLTWPIRAVTRLRYIAKTKNLPFNMEAADIVIPPVCPVLGLPFVFGADGYRHPHGPSVDRIIPALGYVKGNVRVICNLANRLKHELTDAADLRKVVADLESRSKETPP